MKPKTMILMILAIVCGLVASYMTSQLIAQNKEVVIALKTKGKMTQWSTIRAPEEQFEEVEVLKKNAPQNLVHPAEWKKELKGRRLRSTVDEGTVLTEDHLLKKEVTGIDAMLEKGKRAMSIPISADRAVAFFVVPGSKVDVVCTRGGAPPEILLQNVLVLAIDLSTQRAEDKVGAPGATATLQMDNDEQVLKVAAARDRGSLQLVMRPPNDDSTKSDDPTVAVAPPPPIAPPPPPFEDPKEEVKTPGVVAEAPKKNIRSIDIVNGSAPGLRYDIERDKEGNIVSITAKTFADVTAEYKAAKDKAAEKAVDKATERAPKTDKVDDK
jgi:Flp pilus assembly protein CpaB